MPRRSFGTTSALVSGFVAALFAPAGVAGQPTPAAVVAKPAAAAGRAVAAKSWAPPRTPDGAPDLQGIWNNATMTPLERRADRGGDVGATLTEEQAQALERQNAQRLALGDAPSPADRTPPPAGTPRIYGYNDYWLAMGTTIATIDGKRRTSLIVDPPDGRIPYTPEARAAQARVDARRETGPWESYKDLRTGERCLTEGIPWTPYGYNNNFQIVQTAGHLAILREQNSEVRVIPIDGRPHLAPPLRSWMGDSRGRWEGDTLVVETTNFLDRKHLWWVATWKAARPTLRVVERFTRVGPDRIDYAFTIEDPTTFTSPWTAVVPMNRTDERMFEFACHEGNYAAGNILRGARVHEAETAKEAEAAKKGSK